MEKINNNDSKKIISKEMNEKEKKNKYEVKKKIFLLIILIAMLVILICTYYFFVDKNNNSLSENNNLYDINYLVRNNILKEVTTTEMSGYVLYDSANDISYDISASINKNSGIKFDYEKCSLTFNDNYVCKNKTAKSSNILEKVKYVTNSPRYIIALTEDGNLYQSERSYLDSIPDFTLFNKIKTNGKVEKLFIDDFDDFYAYIDNKVYAVDEFNFKLGKTYQELYPYPIIIYTSQFSFSRIYITYDNKLIFSDNISKNPNKNKYIEDQYGKTIIVKDVFLDNSNEDLYVLSFISDDDKLYQMEFYRSDFKNGIVAKPKLISDLEVKNFSINRKKDGYEIGSVNVVFSDNSSKKINYSLYIYSTSVDDYYEYSYIEYSYD